MSKSRVFRVKPYRVYVVSGIQVLQPECNEFDDDVEGWMEALRGLGYDRAGLIVRHRENLSQCLTSLKIRINLSAFLLFAPHYLCNAYTKIKFSKFDKWTRVCILRFAQSFQCSDPEPSGRLSCAREMTNHHHFQQIFSEVRIIVAKYLREDREQKGEYCRRTVKMLFDPVSPFAPELSQLFLALIIRSAFVYSLTNVKLFRLPEILMESECQVDLTLYPVVERMLRHVVKLEDFNRDFHAWIESYTANLKNLELFICSDCRWFESVSCASQILEHLTLRGSNETVIDVLQGNKVLESLKLAETRARDGQTESKFLLHFFKLLVS